MKLKKIYIDPVFHDLLNNFRFFFVGINMMSMPDFQKALINGHKGEKSELEISVQCNDLKCVQYDVKDVLDSFNQEVGLNIEGDKVTADIKKLMNFQARQIAVSLFDILRYSDFSSFISQTDIFKFAKHIRNGAAHNNKFNFDEKAKSELPVLWKNKTIESNLHGNEVFNKFLSPADLVLLISDISEIIKNRK